MTEYQCTYDGLCNLVHRSIKRVNGSMQPVQGCLVSSCIKDQNYLFPIIEKLSQEISNLNLKKSELEKDVESK